MILDHHQFTYRLFHSIQTNANIYDIKNLLRKISQINLNSIKYDGQTLMHCCCLYNRLDLLKLFVEYGDCDILQNNDNGWLPIHIAIYLGYMDIVYYLLQYSLESII